MATIFCNVEADIDDDLIKKFPEDFDFDSMMKKICEDAGVSVVHDKMTGVDALGNYRLKVGKQSICQKYCWYLNTNGAIGTL